ncbi:MAG: GxxExxY protein [Planctomycetes bacterium]|nr:GxxExxY protein [Planctomycetota bacterium]
MKWGDSKFRPVTEEIIKAFFKVHNELGPGLLEGVYHKALFLELSKEFNVQSEMAFPVLYEGKEVGRYIPDLIVNNKIIIELKAVETLSANHKAQLIAQLRITKVLIGFLVNFANKSLEFNRLDNFYQLEKDGLKLD